MIALLLQKKNSLSSQKCNEAQTDCGTRILTNRATSPIASDNSAGQRKEITVSFVSILFISFQCFRPFLSPAMQLRRPLLNVSVPMTNQQFHLARKRYK